MFGWLFDAAPSLRRLTGSQLSEEIRHWAALTVSSHREGEHLIIELGNFSEEASLFIRLNEDVPSGLQGGKLTKLTDTLYLITAAESTLDLTLSAA